MHLGLALESELGQKIWCVKGMHLLKVVSSEKIAIMLGLGLGI